MHFRSVFCVTAILALAVAVPAQAAVILQLGPQTDLNGGLISRNVIAVGTEGETIAGFDAINLTNAHQVFNLSGGQTPGIDDNGGFGWGADWTAYDSHVLIPAADKVGVVGSALGETNAGNTSAEALGLSQQFNMYPQTGFGTLASVDATDGFRLLPGLQGPSIEFLQVVTTPMTAFLDVAVGYFPEGSTAGATARIQGFEIGGEGGNEDITPPEIMAKDIHYQILAPFDPNNPPPISEQLMATDDMSDSSALVWSGLSYTGGPGKNTDFSGQDDGSLGAGGIFDWDPRGWRQGVHEFSATVADEAGNQASGVAVRVDLWVPEPATASLLGLALVGLAGFTRRRS